MKTDACALLYNLEGTPRGRKVKFILIRLGIRIKNVSKEDYLQTIGFLTGSSQDTRSDAVYEGVGFSEEMLVMKGFTQRQLDDFLMYFRKEKIPKIHLKAVVTPTNQSWNSLQLYEEIKKEHEQMGG